MLIEQQPAMSAIPVADVTKYETMFDEMEPVNGKLDGLKCKPVMMKSQLSNETLGRIWDLSDIDDDGCLDRKEFVLAMYLCHRCSEGAMLPESLPPNLIPPGKEAYLTRRAPLAELDVFANSSLQMLSVSSPGWPEMSLVPIPNTPTSPSSSHYSQMLGGPPPILNYPPWAVTQEESTKYNHIFNTIDTDADGLINGMEVRDVFLRSRLPQPLLAQIWNLVDVHGTGMLDCGQFAVAMHLITDMLSKPPAARTLPNVLPPALVPPSLRPLPPDPAIFEESNRLIAEIEAINRQRVEVENSFTTMTVETQRRATESTCIQRQLDTLEHTLRSLVTQRSEAERRLADYSLERDTLERTLQDVKDHISEERKRVEEMKNPVNSQEEVAKRESIERLRSELSTMTREVTLLQDRITEQQRRLQEVQGQNIATQERIDKATARHDLLQSVRDQLRDTLDQCSNGTAELDGAKITTLLNSHDESLRQLETVKSSHNNFSQPLDRLAPISVPPATMNTSRLDGLNNGIFNQHSQIPTDPFRGVDPFASELTVKPGNSPVNDPFAPVNLFSNSDPFGGVDPFGGDPFSAGTTQAATAFQTTENSAFDPFTNLPTLPSKTSFSISGADLDALFDSKPTDVKSTTDPFERDPFGILEQKTAVDESPSTSTRRSPPPRPTLQPGEGRLARKSSAGVLNRTGRLTSAHSIGSLPNVSRTSNSNNVSNFNTISSGGSGKSSFISKIRSKNKTKSHDHSSPWVPPGLSEAEQLSLATKESERLARQEEWHRKQEEAELQLALRMSQLDAQSS